MRITFDTIARIGGEQQGRVSHAQLLAAGIDRDRIKRWRADGRLHPMHVGVYAIGHVAPSLLADLRAAVLAGGAGAVVSHRSAAHALRILPSRPARVEITVPTLAGRARPGLVIHRVKALHHDVTTTIGGIPITSSERVLLDLAPRLSPAELTRACHEAWIHHATTPAGVEACITRNPTKKGAGKLRRALGSDVVLSDLESGFLKLLERHDLPLPRTNVDHAGDKVDCHWEHNGLIVELLSFRFHGTRRAFEDDVARRRRSRHIAYSWATCSSAGRRPRRSSRAC